MWDQRYSSESYAYGTEANDFLVSTANMLPSGKALCLAEGEGRNAVWLAQQGLDVTAVDASEVGLRKARNLAAKRGVSITTLQADLMDFEIAKNHWDSIISIFCHLPPTIRREVHKRCVDGLRPGGIMLLEAYTPKQLEYNTGGPQVTDMMMNQQVLTDDFEDLELLYLSETVREIHEGEYHNGKGAVVQLLARKP
ncbi:MAG: methyltransferase domain-containing protein [Candidatus Thiodiazotropha sp. (ex Monitilora ramsayi)]|nr:methyltransferase domain-containing protein [Candidatus Thiodiazotropha sp. (ex Monitilora ramsayi)]